MMTALLAMALLSPPPQAPQSAAQASAPPLPTHGVCGFCAPPASLGPSDGPFSTNTKFDLALGVASGFLTGWRGAGSLAETSRSPGAVFRGTKPAIVWGAAGAIAMTKLLVHDRNEPLGVTVSSRRPRPPWFLDTKVRGWTGGRLSPGARHWMDRASYWTLGHLAAQPLGLSASGLRRPDRVQDLLIPLEAAAVSALIAVQTKHLFHRTRPYAYYCEPLSPNDVQGSGARLSFFSGHAAIAFALAASTSRVASVRQWEHARTLRRLNYSLASATGVLRILADRHYLTDVLAGAVTGWAAGHYIAKWRAKAETGSVVPAAEVNSLASLSLPAGRFGVVTAQFGRGFGVHVQMAR